MPIRKLRHRHSRTLKSLDPAAFFPIPPFPPPVHIVGLDRVGPTVLAFTFDTLLIDPASCGDLQVQDQRPSYATQTGDYSLEAVYPAMVNGNRWTAHTIDGEPTFANDAQLADDGGLVPDWL